MVHEAAIENTNTHHVKLINIFRVFIYLYVIWIQVFWKWVLDPSNFSVDPMIVLVPLFLVLTDCILMYWSNRNLRRFWNVLPLISLLAILVSVNTIVVTINIGNWAVPNGDLLGLGFVVIALSVAELVLWIKRNQVIMQGFQDLRTSEIRTYDT